VRVILVTNKFMLQTRSNAAYFDRLSHCPGLLADLDAPPECAAHTVGGAKVASATLQHALLHNLTIIFVLDANFARCWERVPVNDLTRGSLLKFAAGLKDVLTATPDNPAGDPLKVCTAP